MGSSPGETRSLAVLPFRPVGAADSMPSLELGLADTLIHRLSSLAELIVRPLGAVRRYAGVDCEPGDVGREQRVDAVVHGSVRLVDGRLRVSARLQRVADGVAVWSAELDEEIGAVLAIEDALAHGLASALSVSLSPRARQRMRRGETRTSEAYRLYLLGRAREAKHTPEDAAAAIEYFERAIAEDPDYALAWVGLAHAHEFFGTIGVDPAHAYGEARAAAERALALAPDLAEAHACLGNVAWQHERSWDRAVERFQHALTLDPGRPELLTAYSDFCSMLGASDEAIALARRALAADPVSPWSNALLAQALYNAKRFDEALAQTELALEFDPEFAFAHFFAGMALVQLGDHDVAVERFERALELGERPDFACALGHAYAVAGQLEQARGLLGELEAARAERPFPAVALAAVHLGLGNEERVFELLEQSFDEPSWHILLLHVDPVFARTRQDPRAQRWLSKLGVDRWRLTQVAADDGTAGLAAAHGRIGELFQALVDLTPAQRESALAELAVDDAEHAPEVRRLLAAHDASAEFLVGIDLSSAGALLAEAPAPSLPPTIGRYEIVRLISRGTLGVVYEARDPALGRAVVVKCLPESLQTDPIARERLGREARAASAVDNPHVQTVYEVGTSVDGVPYVSLALYRGQTLTERLREGGPLAEAEVRRFGAQLAEGLAAAHAVAIVHRDVKPSNLMWTDEGMLKILDFGIAKLADRPLTRTGVTLGTVSYMSPEQTRRGEVGAATDLWAVGAVLYEALTGARPFEAANDQAVIYRIRNDAPRPLREVSPATSPGLAELVAECLDKDPTRRPRSAAEIAERLR